MKHRLVIVGGGFAGIKTALELSNDSRFDITIISDRTNFRVYPTLYLVSTGGSQTMASISLQEIFAGKSVTVIHDTIQSYSQTDRTLTAKDGTLYTYDTVVFALGVVTNYFNISGLAEYSYGIKSTTEARRLKQHLHKQLLDAHQPDLNYVIIGGGPTGVELAGALPGYLQSLIRKHNLPKRHIHVDLIEAAPRILPRMPKDISKAVTRNLKKHGVKIYTKTSVQAQTADALLVNDKPIRSHTVVWTAGVANHPFFTDNNFQLAANHKVRVDQFLQSSPGVYVIGDNADTPYSGMAQTAIHDARQLAANLQRIISHQEPRPYHAKKPIYVIPAGPRWAIVLWGKIRIKGRAGWVLRSLADLIQYHDYLPRGVAFRKWMTLDDIENECTHCDKVT